MRTLILIVILNSCRSVPKIEMKAKIGTTVYVESQLIPYFQPLLAPYFDSLPPLVIDPSMILPLIWLGISPIEIFWSQSLPNGDV